MAGRWRDCRQSTPLTIVWPNSGESVITYVDTSVLLRLVIDEEGSDRALTMWVTSEVVASVHLVVVEARAAPAAAARLGRLTEAQRRTAVTELHQIVSGVYLVELTEQLVAGAAGVALCAAAARRGLHIADPLSP